MSFSTAVIPGATLSLAADSGAAISGSKVYGPFFVGSYSAVQIIVKATGTSTYQTNLEWATDSAFGMVLLGQVAAVGGGGGNLAAVFPVAGPWVRFTITATNFVAGDTVSVSIVPTHINQSAASLLSPVIIDPGQVSIAANTTQTFGPGLIAPGAAKLLVQTASTNSQITLQELTSTGTWFTFYVINIGAGGMAQVWDLVLSRNPCRFQISNFEAAARSYFARLGTIVY